MVESGISEREGSDSFLEQGKEGIKSKGQDIS